MKNRRINGLWGKRAIHAWAMGIALTAGGASATATAACEGGATYDAATGELTLPLMDIATVPLIGGYVRPYGSLSVPTSATLRIIPGTTLFEIQEVTEAVPDPAPSEPPCHATYSLDGALLVPLVEIPTVTAIGGVTVTTVVERYQATLELLPMSDLLTLRYIDPLPECAVGESPEYADGSWSCVAEIPTP